MKDKNGIELRVGDYVKTRPTGLRSFYIGVVDSFDYFIRIRPIGVDSESNYGRNLSGWASKSITKITEEEAIFLLLKGND